jgi:hypothetical protein
MARGMKDNFFVIYLHLLTIIHESMRVLLPKFPAFAGNLKNVGNDKGLRHGEESAL